MICMAEGFSRTTQSMRIDRFDFLVRKMAYFELLARCRWLSHTISMAEGFSRTTQSMPIDGFDLLVVSLLVATFSHTISMVKQ